MAYDAVQHNDGENWDQSDEDDAIAIFEKLSKEHGEIGTRRILARVIAIFLDRYPHSITLMMEEVSNLVADDILLEQSLSKEEIEEQQDANICEGEDEREP